MTCNMRGVVSSIPLYNICLTVLVITCDIKIFHENREIHCIRRHFSPEVSKRITYKSSYFDGKKVAVNMGGLDLYIVETKSAIVHVVNAVGIHT